MARTLEAIFRHPWYLFVLLLLPIAVSLAVAYVLPRTYQSTASLWALRRYEVIGATGPESDLEATPAETQAAALTELLQSRAFALTVAKATDVASTLHLTNSVLKSPQLLDDALLQEMSQHVLVTATGYNLFEITYTNENPSIAEQVVASTIQQYTLQSQKFNIVEGQQLLQGFQTQLAKDQQDTNTAVLQEAHYLQTHPALAQIGANPLNDPEYALLDAQRLQAQSILQNLQTTIANLTQSVNTENASNDPFFKIIDAPIVPKQGVSRVKLYLTAGGIGMGVALALCVLYVLLLVRRDRAIYTPLDLQRVAAYPVVLQLPELPLPIKSYVIRNIIQL